MKRYLPFYILGAAILAVAVVSFGLPVSSLWILGLVVLCPLIMMVMMGGMNGGGGHSGHGGTSGHSGTSGHAGADRPDVQGNRDGTGDRPSWLDR